MQRCSGRGVGEEVLIDSVSMDVVFIHHFLSLNRSGFRHSVSVTYRSVVCRFSANCFRVWKDETSFLSKCIHYTDRYISVNKMNARNQQSDSRVHSKPTQVLGFDPTQKALGLNPISIVPPLT